jgi:hypothetical protein
MARLNVLLFGAGGHARVVLDTLLAEDRVQVTGIIDPRLAPGTSLLGVPILGNDADLPRLAEQFRIDGFVVGIGDNWQRWQLTQRILQSFPHWQPISAVHPTAWVSPFARLGPGTLVLPGAIVNAGAEIGPGCILNTHCSVDHDCPTGRVRQPGPPCVSGRRCLCGRLRCYLPGRLRASRTTNW